MQRGTVIDAWRGIGLMMACFALGLRLIVPVGFMPSADGSGGLVICSGGLPAAAAQTPGEPSEPIQLADKVCAFAGQATATPVEAFALSESRTAVYAPPAVRPLRDVIPGRGLAAPPPPAIGPPIVQA